MCLPFRVLVFIVEYRVEPIIFDYNIIVMNNNQMHPQMQQIYQMQNQMFNQQQPSALPKNSLQDLSIQEMMQKKANLIKQQQSVKTLKSNSSVFIPRN